MHNEKFPSFLREKFDGDPDAERAIAFLEKDFSSNGEITVGSVMLYAMEAGRTLAEVLAVCEEEWNRNWNYQHPDLRGDMDAPGGAGIQNRASICNIHAKLGIPMPQSA